MKKTGKRIFVWYKDAIAAGVLFLIFAYAVYASKDIRTLIAASVNAKFFPTIVGIFGMALSAVNLIKGMISGNALRAAELAAGQSEDTIDPEQRIWNIKIILNILLLIAYLLIIEVLGFVPASALYMIAQIYLMANKARPKPAVAIIVAVAVALICYLFFRNAFYLMLPQGLMPF